MARLSICLLGPFQVTLDGKPVTGFESDKVRALLAYLAVEAGRAHRREKLAGLLWPDQPERSARRNLRRAVFSLRTAIGDRAPSRDGASSGSAGEAPSFLHSSQQTIQFNADSDAWVDVLACEECLASSPLPATDPQAMHHLEESVALYRGPFLEGFSLAGCAAFEEWALFEGERLQRLMVEALQRLSEWYADQGRVEKALGHAWRLVELDPWRESGQQQVMRLLASSGKRAEALAQYEACRRHLAEELAVEPSAETTALYERIRDGTYEAQAEAPGPIPVPRYNLPAHLTPFVGRQAELTQIQEQLRDPDCRLLTLTGPGGIGKTRLALEAAEGCLEDFEHGVFQVRLAGVRSAEAIVPAMAQAIGFSFYEGGEPRQQLVAYLRRKQMLLIVDNYEHLLNGVDLVSEILRAAPGVTTLITSRIRLNLKGEQLLPVAGLSFPREGTPEAEADGEYDAVTLFLAGARRVCPGFGPAGQERQVGRICRLVEGMPLALLLAAAWVELLPPAEIADRIAHSLGFLEGDWQDVPERHRSMRAVFDPMWRLLDERAGEVFEALSVFLGGFSGPAAQQVAGATLWDLRALANRSLLQRTPAGRYEVHELLRQYASERLAQAPARDKAVRDSHSAYYAAALERWAEDLKGARQLAALAEMDVEIDNARAAWDWAVAEGQVDRLDRALDGLAGYYDLRARYPEAETVLQSAEEALQAAAPGGGLRLLVRVLAWQGLLTWRLGHTELAKERLARCLALLDDPRLDGADTRREKAFALYCQGYAVHDVDRDAARDLLEQSVALYEVLGDGYWLACALKLLGEVVSQLGDYGEGRRLIERGMAQARAAGDQRTVAWGLQWLSLVAVYQGQVEESARFSRESADIYRALGARAELAYSLVMLTGSVLLQGRFDEARSHALTGIQAYDELGLRHAYSAMARMWLGMVEWGSGNYEQGRLELESALALARETDWMRGVGACLLGLGAISLVDRGPEQALRLLEESTSVSQGIKQLDDYAWALAIMGYAECERGKIDQAGKHLFKALRLAAELGAMSPVAFVLPGIAWLRARCGQAERAVELYALTSGTPIGRWRWFEDTAGKHISAAAETLPPETVAAAEARGRARNLKSTVAELLAEEQGSRNPPGR